MTNVTSIPNRSQPKFKVGDKVRLKHQPESPNLTISRIFLSVDNTHAEQLFQPGSILYCVGWYFNSVGPMYAQFACDFFNEDSLEAVNG